MLRIAFRWRIYGADHVPRAGAVIVCANHTNMLDPVVVGCALTRRVHFMSKKELFAIPVLRSLLKMLGAYPVNRYAPDRRAIRKSLQLLADGHVIGIFPEGTRSKDGVMKAGEAGVAMLAARSGALVVPAGISRHYRLFGPITIRFGPAIMVAPRGGSRAQSDRKATDLIMDAIRTLAAPGEGGAEHG